MISAHRYHGSGMTRLIDEEEDGDDEDEGLLRRHTHRRRNYGDSDASGADL